MGIGADLDPSHWPRASSEDHRTEELNGTEWGTNPSADHSTLTSDRNARDWQGAGEDCQSGTKNPNVCYSESIHFPRALQTGPGEYKEKTLSCSQTWT